MTVISTRQLQALDLVGPADIGKRLGVTAQAIPTWRKRFSDFPEPELRVGHLPLWRWPTVQAWAHTHGRSIEVRRGEVTSEDLITATKYLPQVRTMLANEVRAAAAQCADLLEEPVGRPPVVKATRDARGRIRSRADRERAGGDGSANDSGQWDWYFSLSPGEQERLRAHLSDSPGALEPDQYAQAIAWRIGSDDIELCMSEWVRATALKDAAALLARGQVPTFPFDAVTTYDVGAMFGPDGAV